MKQAAARSNRSFWRQNGVYFALFALLLLLFRAIPPVLDRLVVSWHYGDGGLPQWLGRQAFNYLHLNGRLIPTFFSGILEAFHSDIPWDVMCALVCVGIAYALCRLFSVEGAGQRALVSVWTVALVLAMPNQMRIETLYYSFLPYITPLLLVLAFLWALRRYLSPAPGNQTLVYALLFCIPLALGNWIEHLSLGFCAALGLTTLWVVLRTRKPNGPLLLACGLAVLGLLGLFLSPGLRQNRALGEELGASAAARLPQHIRSIAGALLGGATPFLALLYLLSFLFSLTSDTPHRGWRAVSLGMNGLCCLFLAGCALCRVPGLGASMPALFRDSFVLAPAQARLAVLLAGCCVLLCALVLSLWFSRYRLEMYFLLATGLFSLGAASLTETLWARLVSFPYLALVCVAVCFTAALLRRGRRLRIGVTAGVLVISLLAMDQVAVQVRRIGAVQAERELQLADALRRQQRRTWDYDNDLLVLPDFREDDVYLGQYMSPGGDYFPHLLAFYGLSAHTRAMADNTAAYFLWDWDGTAFTIEVQPDAPAAGLSYQYVVAGRETTAFLDSPRFTYTPPESGQYGFAVIIRYADGTERQILQPCEVSLRLGETEGT